MNVSRLLPNFLNIDIGAPFRWASEMPIAFFRKFKLPYAPWLLQEGNWILIASRDRVFVNRRKAWLWQIILWKHFSREGNVILSWAELSERKPAKAALKEEEGYRTKSWSWRAQTPNQRFKISFEPRRCIDKAAQSLHRKVASRLKISEARPSREIHEQSRVIIMEKPNVESSLREK